VIAVADLFSSISIINTNLSVPACLPEGSSTYYYKVIICSISLKLAYRRLGYISKARVKMLAYRLIKNFKFFPDIGYQTSKYNYYIIKKIKILLYLRRQLIFKKADKLIKILYLNLLQGFYIVFKTSFEYFFIIVDDYIKMV
jgi:hypothetical protein